jgi:hypothetical protein
MSTSPLAAQLDTVGLCASCFLEKPLGFGGAQLLHLRVEALAVGRYPCIAVCCRDAAPANPCYTKSMFDDLISHRQPPPNRARACEGGIEHHLTEGAVMVAFAMHLLRTVPNLRHVAIHPDGEHGKRFDFQGWLKKHGFVMVERMGSTPYGGKYQSDVEGHTILINPKSGRGDVVADIGGKSFVAECKGGIINSRHAGQLLIST